MITRKLDYASQFNKLTEAYIRNEVNPMTNCNCFVGNLLNNRPKWAAHRFFPRILRVNPESLYRTKFTSLKSINYILEEQTNSFYTPSDILLLERMFLKTFLLSGGNEVADWYNPLETDEDALFVAFEKTLDLLKEIHISKGEIIEEVPTFVKRQLA